MLNKITKIIREFKKEIELQLNVLNKEQAKVLLKEEIEMLNKNQIEIFNNNIEEIYYRQTSSMENTSTKIEPFCKNEIFKRLLSIGVEKK